MAGLNDNVEEGLDGSIDPTEINTLVVKPSATGPVHQALIGTVVNQNSEHQNVPAEELFGKIVPGEIPNIEAQFALIEKGRAKIVDLKDLEANMVEQDSISREDANLVEHAFGQFFGPRLSAEEFTKAPSKTNFSQTLRFIKTRIAKEESELITEIDTTVNKPLQDLKVFESQIVKSYLEFMQDQILTVQTKFESVLKDIEVSKNTVLPAHSEFINIVMTPIDQIPVDGLDFSNLAIKDEGALPNVFAQSLNVLNDIFQCPKMLNFYYHAVKDMTYQPSMSLKMHIPSPTIFDLVSLYQENKLTTVLSDLKSAVKKSVDDFERIAQKLHDASQDFEKLNQQLLDNAKEIRALSYNVTTLYGVSKDLILMNAAMQNVFAFLNYCL